MAGKTHPVLSDEAVELVAARFQALGDSSRIRLLNRLMQGERAVQDLVDETGLSQTNVSRHLALLRNGGIVERRSDGNRAVYRIADPTVVALCEVVCDGLARGLATRLGALPAPAGRRPRRRAARP